MIPTVDQLRADPGTGAVEVQRRRRQRISGPFLAGPVKWGWIQQAGRLPGKALHVAIALSFRAGILRRREVPMPLNELERMGVSRHAARRGLLHLEKLGLVVSVRAPGRKTIVRLPEVDQEVVHGSR